MIVRRTDGVGERLEADAFCYFNPSLIYVIEEMRRTRRFPEGGYYRFHALLPPNMLECYLAYRGRWMNLKEAFEAGEVVCDEENEHFFESDGTHLKRA